MIKCSGQNFGISTFVPRYIPLGIKGNRCYSSFDNNRTGQSEKADNSVSIYGTICNTVQT